MPCSASAMACMLAAVPLTAPYWVSIAGVLELWLVDGEPGAALVFFLLALAPMMFVDEAFYRELKCVMQRILISYAICSCARRTSHPYLTGLTIVGGIYWLGLQVCYHACGKCVAHLFVLLQGAIVGPIILCCVLTLVNVLRLVIANTGTAGGHQH